MTTETEKMLASMEEYFDKVQEAVVTGGSSAFRYLTGTVSANGSTIVDAPTQLGYNSTTHQIYSLGVELRMVDPLVGSNPPVVDATSTLTYQIATDGKLTILNNYAGVVTYHARITMPVKKP